MHIQYGGVNLNLISINEFSRQAVYLGKNYVYTKFRLNVRCWLNPATQADTPQTESPTGGLLTGGILNGPGPVISDVALRNNLLQPRQRLVFSFLGVNSLVSPLPGFTVDSTGGPIPVSCNVQQRSPKTWVVDWVVETNLNETYVMKGQPISSPFILAQLVKMSQDINEDYFTTRVIEGQALFNLDALVQNQLVPDDFRNLLVVPPPFDYKREKVEVQNDPDEPGLIRYRVVDRQLPFGWGGSHVSRVKAVHSIRTTKANPGSSLWGGIGKGIADLSDLRPGSGMKEVVGSWFDTMPVSIHRIDVDVWGDPLSRRSGLEAFARQIVGARLFQLGLLLEANNPKAAGLNQNGDGTPKDPYLRAATGIFGRIAASIGMAEGGVAGAIKTTAGAYFQPFGVDTNIVHDITAKYVHLDYTAFDSAVGTVLNSVGGIIDKTPMGEQEETWSGGKERTGTPLISAALWRGPWPASSNGMRGTTLADVIGQTLQAPYTVSPDNPAGLSPSTIGVTPAYPFGAVS